MQYESDIISFWNVYQHYVTEREFPKSPNTSNQPRADASARELWIDGLTAFCDVRVFNPLARCHLHHSLPAGHKSNENEKKRDYYQQIIRVEHESFIALVFMFWRNEQGMLSFLFAEERKNRRKEPKSKISAWIKARLIFALIRSMLLCWPGTRTPANVDSISKIDLCAVVTESNIEWITYRFIPRYFTIMNMYG